MNTKLTYLYRDGSNYKSWGEVIFAGNPTEEFSRRMAIALERSEFFIADQIRVPELFFENWPRYDDDHCWHEFDSLDATEEPATDQYSRMIEDFVTEIENAARSGWRVFDPKQRVKGNKETT